MKKLLIGVGIYTAICFIVSAISVLSERRAKKKLQELSKEFNNIAYMYGDDDYLAKLLVEEDEDDEEI